MEEAADELADFMMAVDSTVTKKNLVANLKVLKKSSYPKLNLQLNTNKIIRLDV